MAERVFSFYINYQWKTGEFRATKNAPGVQGGYWVPVKFTVTLRIPETEPEVKTTIELPPTKVVSIVTELLEE